MSHPFFTIGHSTRPLDEFARLLPDNRVDLVVDVRTVPRSRTNPQYNMDTLPGALGRFDIGYVHLPALGGLRSRHRDISPALNGFWSNASFHNYADYATTEPFRRGLAELRELGRAHRCAVMCSEAVWWRCHRRIIADYLLRDGHDVSHILGHAHVEPATMTPAATRQAGDVLVYPQAPEHTGRHSK